MASTVIRRPLPALIALVALLLLTGIVWWRVLHRGSTTANACPTPTPTPSSTSSKAALPAASAITAAVLNSTTRNGIAASVRRSLLADGFQVPTPASDDQGPQVKTNTGVAQLRYGPSGAQAALHLRYYFPGAALVPTTSTSAAVVVALGEKFTTIATPAAVAAAMKADSVAVSSPAPSSTPTSAAASATC